MIYNLNTFISPPWEVSRFKGIPIAKYTPQTMNIIREVVGRPVRVKFRGPRPAKNGRSFDARRATCLKEDATTFTVYVR